MNQAHNDPNPHAIRELASAAAKGHVAALADIAGLALATGVTRRQGWIYLPDATKPIARTWAEFGEFISDGLTGRARLAAADMARVLAKQGTDLSAAEARAVAVDRAKAEDQRRTWVNAVMSHGGLTIRQAEQAVRDEAHHRANLIEIMAREFYIHAGYIGVASALQERDADLTDWQSGKVAPSMRDMAYQYAHAIDTIAHQQ